MRSLIAGCAAKQVLKWEAPTAVSVACLTVYDMCKAVDKGMTIEAIGLDEKLGGKKWRMAKIVMVEIKFFASLRERIALATLTSNAASMPELRAGSSGVAAFSRGLSGVVR